MSEKTKCCPLCGEKLGNQDLDYCDRAECKKMFELYEINKADIYKRQVDELQLPKILSRVSHEEPYHLQRIPVEFTNKGIFNFDGERHPSYNGLIFGECGVGKTHLAVGLLRKRVIQKYLFKISSLGINAAVDLSAYEEETELHRAFSGHTFIPYIDLIWEMGSFYNEQVKLLMNHLSNTEYLILDDFGADKPSDRAREIMYKLLFSRHANKMPTLITSNLNLSRIAELFGDRLTSRIADFGPITCLEGKDRRLDS